MKSAIIAATCLATASAFAPSSGAGRSATSLSATEAQIDFFGLPEQTDFSQELGVTAPLGFFDPLGLLKDGDQSTFDDLREKELKHGRISMLAVVGYLITAAGARFPGCEDIPDGFAAFSGLYGSKEGQFVALQMGLFFVVAEIINREAYWAGCKSEFPGDYRNGWIDFGWDTFSDEVKFQKRTIELNNGRAAMMGIWGLMLHEQMGVSILPGGYLPGHP
ncbi:hypothetical protein THAOC_20855 [Thalassiosira oceanica]|uniref:Plastid light harvesting protein n=1 Tax=Thalassiosira oceanica TaxID=159749 RepID=K0SDE5_THAOC|nr:hypothetical protein THAOC_20855 [Thalassiosira oceanica]|mmetsp:Transcript_22879/g.53950  ORF Transcript_22879/g.53950 Transcript_22879/m.53950 type:complete len:220 (+) Transcript_22879:73-732(+)|eukprot:EJK58981.1 hypothetical protein THAOC_20855 [Thalassiosira oceanica]